METEYKVESQECFCVGDHWRVSVVCGCRLVQWGFNNCGLVRSRC